MLVAWQTNKKEQQFYTKDMFQSCMRKNLDANVYLLHEDLNIFLTKSA